MLEKNRNTGSIGISDLMRESACLLVVELFGDGEAGGGGGDAAADKGKKGGGMSFKFFQKARDRMSRRSKRPAGGARGKRKGATSTLGSVFKGSLESLMKKLQSATPQFVRCIKPNLDKQPGKFLAENVIIQLR